MNSCYDVHDEWVAAVVSRKCTISLHDYHANWLKAQAQTQAETKGKLTVSSKPLSFALEAACKSTKPKRQGPPVQYRNRAKPKYGKDGLPREGRG